MPDFARLEADAAEEEQDEEAEEEEEADEVDGSPLVVTTSAIPAELSSEG